MSGGYTMTEVRVSSIERIYVNFFNFVFSMTGLTLLLPYILTTRPNWSSCKLRVFCLANRKEELDSEQRRCLFDGNKTS